MVPRALLRSSFWAALALTGCTSHGSSTNEPAWELVDVSQVPPVVVMETDTALHMVNGTWYLAGKPFSGWLRSRYPGGAIKRQGSYYLGLQHGITRTYYPDGRLQNERSYRRGLAYGRHRGYWENGDPRFDYQYLDDRREGWQRRWYQGGKPYMALHYSNDREEGMQKGWRENGKLFLNYEVKNGIRYGLQSSALCYTLKNGQLK